MKPREQGDSQLAKCKLIERTPEVSLTCVPHGGLEDLGEVLTDESGGFMLQWLVELIR